MLPPTTRPLVAALALVGVLAPATSARAVRAAELPPPALIARHGTGFDPVADAYAFGNALAWHYGTPVAAAPGAPPSDPAFIHHCSQMARAARQFFYAARFAPELPATSRDEYRRLVAKIMRSDPRARAPAGQPIVIPGFADLNAFSLAHEVLLKQALGGRWRAFVQRGNWRMLFTFSPQDQRRTAASLLASIEAGHPPIVHVVRYPRVTINHTFLLHRAEATTNEIVFFAYDPNQPAREVSLRYLRGRAEFELEPTTYWQGGVVSTYEVFHAGIY